MVSYDLLIMITDLPLVEETEEDRKLASLIKYKSVENYDERQAKKRKAIEDASVSRDFMNLQVDKWFQI